MSIFDSRPLGLIGPSLAALAALSASILAAPAAEDCGPGDGHCHLARWEPQGPAPGNDAFGSDVAIHGNLAVVAARQSEDVHVYERQGPSWVLIDQLEDPGPAWNSFADAVAVHNDRIAVGAPYDDTVGYRSGAVHIYERDGGGGFELVDTLYDDSPTPEGYFGRSLEMTEHWLAVGASGDSFVGTVHTFLELAGGWTPAEVVAAPGAIKMGYTVAVHEVSPFELILFTSDIDVDVVRHFRVTPGLVEQLVTLQPDQADSFFGSSLAYDGHHLVVGASNDSDVSPDAGAVYVFEVEPGDAGAAFLEKLLPCSETEGHFGADVAVDGNRIAVGAHRSGLDGQGGAAVYRPELFGSGWTLEDVVKAQDELPDGHFGHAIALDGNTLLVGSLNYSAAADSSGAAYLVSLEPGAGLSGQCPCDVLGSAVEYGTGKLGSAGVPRLSAKTPIPGEAHLLKLTNVLVGAAPFLLWSFTPMDMPFDDGSLLVANPTVTLLPVVGVLGQVGIGWTVSNNPALCGLDIYAQAMMLDPGAAGPYHTTQSNGLRLTVGY